MSADPMSASAGVSGLIDEARAYGREPLGRLLQLYRNYLTIVAAAQLGPRVQARLGPSDLVQEAMLAAHRDFPRFRGQTEREFLAWLRQILINRLRHTIAMHVSSKKRDIRREVSLDRIITPDERSGACLAACLADSGPTPSAVLREREREAALADQIARLKPEYRDVIVLRNLQGLSFAEIAKRMDRKTSTVRKLWLRAMGKLKELCEPIE